MVNKKKLERSPGIGLRPWALADNSDRKANRQIDSKNRQSETACGY